MHTDARTLDDGTLIDGDICVIGAGAAGISMALEWIGSPHRVILLEGGGFDLEPRLQALYRGESVGRPYYPLEAARLHYFGGTTGHWAGFCSTMDPIDFERRDWVPHSGWPIRREDLEPFFARAQYLPELGPFEYDAAYWEALDPDVIRLPLDEKVVWTKMWQFSRPTRFGTVYRDQIVNAPNVHLYTYANVCEVEANESVTAVRGLRVVTIDGKTHRVQARHYVLACGAIHNARLLLASNRQTARGLGNENDQVGRYFMEHIEISGAQLVFTKPQPIKMYALLHGQTRARGELALTREAQREHRVLNGTASFQPGGLSKNPKGTFQTLTPDLLEGFMRLGQDRDETHSGDSSDALPPTPFPQREGHLLTRQEQAPNPDSRVSLSAERDELGMPRIVLDWRLTELDKRSIRVFYEVLGRALGSAGLGRIRLAEWLLEENDNVWPSFLSGSWHHMGTLRMHQSPRNGVVDADCRVHGLGNLYVAGSAVFPTAGSANPMLALIALTLRLSDHLKTKMG